MAKTDDRIVTDMDLISVSSASHHCIANKTMVGLCSTANRPRITFAKLHQSRMSKGFACVYSSKADLRQPHTFRHSPSGVVGVGICFGRVGLHKRTNMSGTHKVASVTYIVSARAMTYQTKIKKGKKKIQPVGTGKTSGWRQRSAMRRISLDRYCLYCT